MADIEVSIGSVAEIPKGLDKVAEATHNAVSKGVLSGISEIPKGIFHAIEDFKKANAIALREGDIFKGGSVTSLQRQVNKYVKQLKAVPLTAETQPELLKAALATRVYVNQTASMAREFGTPTAISLSTMSQEMVRNMVNETRGFPAAQAREQQRAENEAKRQQAAQDREQRRIDREEAKQQAALEREEKKAEAQRLKEEKAKQKAEEQKILWEEDRRVRQENFAFFDNEYAMAMAELNTAQTPDEIKSALKNLRRVGRHRMGASAGIMGVQERYALSSSTEEDITEGEEKLTKAIEDNTDIITRWTKDARSYIAAGGMGIAAGNYVSNLMKSYYANRKDPYTELGGKIDEMLQWGGGALGAILGGLVGGPVGAVLGGGAGTVIGGWWNRTRAAAMSTQEDAIEQLRWAIKYGGQGVGWQYAQLAEKTGFASAADIESLQMSAETFGPSAALGQVSADQWFALAHMPNYAAALDSHADAATLLAALQADMGMYSPGWGMKFVQMLGLPDDLRVLATSGMLESLNRDIPQTQRMAAYLGQAAPALVPQYYERGYKDRVQRMETLKKTISDAGAEYYRSVGPTEGRLLGGERSGADIRNFADLAVTDWYDRQPASLSPTTININIDGENALRLQGVYTDDNSLENKVQYTAGSLQ